jgi:hypothetical protein
LPILIDDVSLLAHLLVAEAEGELVEFPAGDPRGDLGDYRAPTGDDPAGVMEADDAVAAKMPSSTGDRSRISGSTPDCLPTIDYEAAAAVWLLAQAGVTLPEAVAYLRSERVAN